MDKNSQSYNVGCEKDHFVLKNVVMSKWTSQQNNFGKRAYGGPFLEKYKYKSAYA